MKDKLLKVFLIMCLCFVPTFGSYAAGSENADYTAPDADNADNKDDCFGDSGLPTGKGYMDENGHITVGLWNCFTGDYYDTRYSLTFWSVHKYASYLFVQRKGSVNDYKYTLMSVDEDGNVVGSWVYEQGTIWSTLTSGVGSEWSKRQCSTPSTLFRPATGDGTFSTNMPIFDADSSGYDEAVQKYIKNGDVSGAENYYDIAKPDQDDSVELPKNVRTYGNVFETATRQLGSSIKYNAMTVRWDPPEDVENYSYDVKIQCTYSVTSNSSLSATGRVPDLTKSETTSAVMIVTDYPYANRGIYDLTTGKEITRGEKQPEDCVINEETLKKLSYSCAFDNMFPRQLKIWVRNRKGNKCSNWVAVSSNASNVSGSNSTARVEDDNGNQVEDDDYNDTPIDNSDKHTYYDTDPDTSTESPKFSLNEFYSYLKSGFGLLGDNGLIAFFAKSFSFLPSEFWSLILAGVGIMIVLGIINFALKR